MKGILFDLDGTLIDSEEIFFKTVVETFSTFGNEWRIVSNKV